MSMGEKLEDKGLIGYKMKKTQHALRLCMDDALRSIDLTTPQYAVLAQLELKPGISNAALAKSSFITAQTMHSIVSNLEKRGLIQRRNDPGHGRILCTELTPQGREVLKLAHNMIHTVESHMLSTVSKEHQELLENLLLECFNNLNSDQAD